MTDKAALKEIVRQEKRFAAAGCGSSYAKAQGAGGGARIRSGELRLTILRQAPGINRAINGCSMSSMPFR